MGSTYSQFLKVLLLSAMTISLVLVSAESTAAKKKKKKGKKAKVEVVEPSSDEDPDDPQVIARNHYSAGKAAYDAEDFDLAETEFQAAYDLKPHPAVLKSIAECKIQKGQNVEAIALLEQLVADAGYNKNEEVNARLTQAKAEVGELEITSNPTNASVELNGEMLEQTTPTRVYVIPGDQNIVARLDGYDDQTKELTIEKGTQSSVVIEFPTEPASSEPALIDPFAEGEEGNAGEAAIGDTKSDGPPKAFWAMAAITGVGLVSGTVFGTMALGAEKDYRDNGDQATKDSGERSAIIADISFGVAIGAAIAGTIILVTHNKKKRQSETAARLSVSPIVSENTMGLTSAFSF